MKHSKISVAQSFTIALVMKGRMVFVGGVDSPLKASGADIAVAKNIQSNTISILSGVLQAVGLWRGQAEHANGAVAKRATVNGQPDWASQSQTLRFTTLSRLMGATGGITC